MHSESAEKCRDGTEFRFGNRRPFAGSIRGAAAGFAPELPIEELIMLLGRMSFPMRTAFACSCRAPSR